MSEASCLLGQIWRNFDASSDISCESFIMLNMKDDDTDVSVSTNNTFRGDFDNDMPGIPRRVSFDTPNKPILSDSSVCPREIPQKSLPTYTRDNSPESPPAKSTTWYDPETEKKYNNLFPPEIDLDVVENNITEQANTTSTVEKNTEQNETPLKTQQLPISSHNMDPIYVNKSQEDILIKVLNRSYLRHIQILVIPERDKIPGISEIINKWKLLAKHNSCYLWLIRKSRTTNVCFSKCYSPNEYSDVPLDKIEDWLLHKDHKKIYDLRQLFTKYDISKKSIALLIVPTNSTNKDPSRMWEECLQYEKCWCDYDSTLKTELYNLFRKSISDNDNLLLISPKSCLVLTSYENIDNMVGYLDERS